MSLALRLPASAVETEVRLRSEMLVTVVQDLLTSAFEASALLLVQVNCSLLVDGPLVVERERSPVRSPARQALTIICEPVPASVHVPAGSVMVAATDDRALAEARLLPLLLSSVMDSEVRRQVAENAMRGALEIANRDPATGLGNRRAWLQSLQVEAARARRTGRPLAILVLDLDGLKAVNDARGHAAGDELIVRTATALTATRRATDQVCRLGGDEFGILAPDTDVEQATVLAARIRQRLSAHHVPVSLGWAVSGGESSIDELWRQADAAMYLDKRQRRS